jgi:hypothetical protein
MPRVHSFAPGCRSCAGVRIRSETAATNGGRSWWAHLAFTRINIAPTILRKKIEDLREADPRLLNTSAFIGTGDQVRPSG